MTTSRKPLGWVAHPTAERAALRVGSGLPRLAAALGVERRALGLVFGSVHYNLGRLRALSLADLLRLNIRLRDAERLFYLVQWEGLQAHLESHGELPGVRDLEPLLATLNPLFIRHFSQGERLNETLIALYRGELSQEARERCLELTPPTRARRVLGWLGLAAT